MIARGLLTALTLGLVMAGPARGQNEPAKPSLAPTKRLVQPGSAPRPAAPAKQPPEPGEQPRTPGGAPEAGLADMAAMMAAMEAAGKPSEAHERLKAFVGEWTAVTRFRPVEQAPWMESTGRSTNRLDWEGRFLISEYSGSMAGTSFTGLSTWGYDNAAQEYQATWRDSVSTGLVWMRGSADAAGKVFTLSGESVEPLSGKRKAFRQVITIKGPDAHLMEFYEISPSGKTFKNMEISYTRAGAAADKPAAPVERP